MRRQGGGQDLPIHHYNFIVEKGVRFIPIHDNKILGKIMVYLFLNLTLPKLNAFSIHQHKNVTNFRVETKLSPIVARLSLPTFIHRLN